MSFFISSYEDDTQFVQAMDCFIGALVEIYDRPELYIIRIDNWFDHKWLGFAGRFRTIYLHIGKKTIMAAHSIWKTEEKTALPPFSPTRDMVQTHFKAGFGQTKRDFPKQLLHQAYKQRSTVNLHNLLLSFSGCALFLWLSSGSATSGRASLLAYHTREDKVAGWYASFVKSDHWKLNLVKGANRDGVDRIFPKIFRR